MLLKSWEELPQSMRNQNVKIYYDILNNKKTSLLFKRVFDLIFAIILFLILLPVFLIVSVMVKIDSKGPIMFKQVRITQYGESFSIYKFRTMVDNADTLGSHITTRNDARITRTGKFLRKTRLDEIPQLLNIIIGDMTFVGTRPEVPKYVDQYTDEMMATLLLPAGATSEASIEYKDEAKILGNADNIDEIYLNEVLPEKMKYNLNSIKKFTLFYELKIMLKTVRAIL